MNILENSKLLIRNLIESKDFDHEELDDLACSIGDQEFGDMILCELVNSLNLIDDLKKREYIVISVFEVLAEEPVSQQWLDLLPKLLRNEKLYWLVTRTYEYQKEALFRHLKKIDTSP